jgi:hypothetical protein
MEADLKEYFEEKYKSGERGWDWIYNCWDDDTWSDFIKDDLAGKSLEEGKKLLDDIAEAYADREDDVSSTIW